MRGSLALLALLGLVLLSACSGPRTAPETGEVLREVRIPPERVAKIAVPDPGQADQDDLWQRIRDQLALDREHPAVQEALAGFEANSNPLSFAVDRAGPWLFHIVEAVESRALPVEFALLPFIESAFDPLAGAHDGAAGLWQIIPDTALALGLSQQGNYDGRHDVIASTDAALDYLTQLATSFDEDWLLTLAAYNAGPGRVRRAIEQNIAEDLPTDFWSLSLPSETQSYVPRVLALAALIESPNELATLPPIPNSPGIATVPASAAVDLADVAAIAGISVDELQTLNPALRNDRTPAEMEYQLVVPLDAAEPLEGTLETLASSAPPASSGSWYEIRRGDTLLALSRRFQLPVAELQRANDLRDHRIRAGAKLWIPAAAVSAASAQ